MWLVQNPKQLEYYPAPCSGGNTPDDKVTAPPLRILAVLPGPARPARRRGCPRGTSGSPPALHAPLPAKARARDPRGGIRTAARAPPRVGATPSHFLTRLPSPRLHRVALHTPRGTPSRSRPLSPTSLSPTHGTVATRRHALRVRVSREGAREPPRWWPSWAGGRGGVRGAEAGVAPSPAAGTRRAAGPLGTRLRDPAPGRGPSLPPRRPRRRPRPVPAAPVARSPEGRTAPARTPCARARSPRGGRSGRADRAAAAAPHLPGARPPPSGAPLGPRRRQGGSWGRAEAAGSGRRRRSLQPPAAEQEICRVPPPPPLALGLGLRLRLRLGLGLRGGGGGRRSEERGRRLPSGAGSAPRAPAPPGGAPPRSLDVRLPRLARLPGERPWPGWGWGATARSRAPTDGDRCDGRSSARERPFLPRLGPGHLEVTWLGTRFGLRRGYKGARGTLYRFWFREVQREPGKSPEPVSSSLKRGWGHHLVGEGLGGPGGRARQRETHLHGGRAAARKGRDLLLSGTALQATCCVLCRQVSESRAFQSGGQKGYRNEAASLHFFWSLKTSVIVTLKHVVRGIEARVVLVPVRKPLDPSYPSPFGFSSCSSFSRLRPLLSSHPRLQGSALPLAILTT
ncbi:nascent polypeptide-associated complex subunit alpha, muscle-specific form-like [Felis catus]|uniref:nascent polypeptide-associated complex subunit alpha, muscle-specific form-like n=1 Tax=Felis catus TaxID=9685 RepID=UPI001D19B816|nr:nascent polypeptide-associated complex subunit alpha, muscle-specific form-like [Felis catus]